MSSPMTQAEVFDACMRQAEFAYTMHNDRRKFEWKVTLGLWALIVASLVKGVALPLWLWLTVVGFYGFLWISQIWTANQNNKDWYDHFMIHAVQVLADARHSVPKPPGKILGVRRYLGFLTAWSMVFQLLATLVLALIAYEIGAGAAR